jgi:hypothetical protein
MTDDPLNKEEDDVPRASGYHAFANCRVGRGTESVASSDEKSYEAFSRRRCAKPTTTALRASFVQALSPLGSPVSFKARPRHGRHFARGFRAIGSRPGVAGRSAKTGPQGRLNTLSYGFFAVLNH